LYNQIDFNDRLSEKSKCEDYKHESEEKKYSESDFKASWQPISEPLDFKNKVPDNLENEHNVFNENGMDEQDIALENNNKDEIVNHLNMLKEKALNIIKNPEEITNEFIKKFSDYIDFIDLSGQELSELIQIINKACSQEEQGVMSNDVDSEQEAQLEPHEQPNNFVDEENFHIKEEPFEVYDLSKVKEEYIEYQ
jgi:hypothetical protein